MLSSRTCISISITALLATTTLGTSWASERAVRKPNLDVLRSVPHLKNLPIKRGTRVFLRGDLNVPLMRTEKGIVVTDATRIEGLVPTILDISRRGGKVILASHLGRPKGVQEELRMGPVADKVAEVLASKGFKGKVNKSKEITGEGPKAQIEKMAAGDVLVLENLRFDSDEKSGNEPDRRAFAETLADLADVYVNDASGTAHHKHASTYDMASFFEPGKKAAGP